jgi:hypothetical protein
MTKRIPIAVALVLALAAPAAAQAGAPASVKLERCKSGDRPKERYATYEARMRSVAGTARMALRFKLLVQEAGDDTRRAVPNDELSTWHRSHDGVTRYVYSQTIRKLHPGASYRVRVRFVWLDDRGNEIKHATRLSDACDQDGPLPNLALTALTLSPGPTAGTSAYGVVVSNTGKSPAPPFSVAVFVDGALADSRTVDGLGPGESETVYLNGPSCTSVRALADREHAVAETNEHDNSIGYIC